MMKSTDCRVGEKELLLKATLARSTCAGQPLLFFAEL